MSGILYALYSRSSTYTDRSHPLFFERIDQRFANTLWCACNQNRHAAIIWAQTWANTIIFNFTDLYGQLNSNLERLKLGTLYQRIYE